MTPVDTVYSQTGALLLLQQMGTNKKNPQPDNIWRVREFLGFVVDVVTVLVFFLGVLLLLLF